MGFWGFVGLVCLLALLVAAVMFPLSVGGHIIGLTPSFGELMNHDALWEHTHYPDIGWRYAVTAVLAVSVVSAILALRAWISEPGEGAPSAVEGLEAPDGRRWVRVIRSTCPACGHIDERAGGVYLCPQCRTPLPDSAYAATGRSVLER
jgi:H+/Cl- antiporter ClcA